MPLYILTQIEGMLPPWARAQFRNPRAWKTIFRCWFATWASFVIILPDASARALGNAGFFALIVAFIVPPSMPIQMFIFLMAMICVGMGMGWGIGAAAMRASIAARNTELLEAQLFRADQVEASSSNPDAVFSSELFRGDFLDWRSSSVFGGFMAFSAILFATIRAYEPHFALLSVFGIITADVFCTIGPLIPIPQYTIISTFFISVACYVGIALLSILFIFPQTMSHVHLGMTVGLLGLMKAYVDGWGEVLGRTPDEVRKEVEGKTGTVGKVSGMRGRILAALQGLMLRNALVEAEFSWCRWSGSDCKKLEEPLTLLVSRLGGLQAFPRLVANYASPIPSTRSALWHSMLSSTSQVFTFPDPPPPMPSPTRPTSSYSQSVPFPSQSRPTTSQSQAQLQVPVEKPANPSHTDITLIAQFSSPRHAKDLTLAATLPRLRSVTLPLREACTGTLGACARVITEVNEKRWAWPWSQSSLPQSGTDVERALDAAIESLRHERTYFVTSGRLVLAEPFVNALPSLSVSSLTKALHATPPLRAYIIASTFSAQLVVIADAILLLAELVQSLCAKRQKSRLWAPSGLRALGNWLIGRRKEGEDGEGWDTSMGEGMGPGVGLDDAQSDGDEKAYKRDPDSRPPSNILQRIMDFTYRIYKWTKSKEALFIFKYTIVTMCLWLPAVFHSTAHLYYVEKAVWGLITAQTIMNIYASDQLYNLIARFIGTVAGMVLGVVIWYIGSGNGTGNRYGLAASLGVFILPIVYLRVFAPTHSSMPYLMCNVTIALVIGYSWLDTAIFTDDNPGVGWPVAWKRTVVVFIGGGASFIMMMIPPTSGRKAVRLHNASIINELGRLYSLLMASWISEEETQYTKLRGRFASTSTIFLSLTRTQTQTNDEKLGSSAKARYPPTRSPVHYVPQWFATFRKRVIPLANQLRGLHLETEAAQWEGSVRGAWPAHEYERLMDLEGEILAALTQLASALSHLEPSWRVSLIRETLVLNPDFITEVMSVFTVSSQSLRTGEPLHQILPSSLLDRLLYHHAHANAVSRLPPPSPPLSPQQLAAQDRDRADRRPKHKKSKMSISEVGHKPSLSLSTTYQTDNRSRSQVQLQLRPKPKASMMSVVSTAYTDIDGEEDTGVQEEVIGNVVNYEERIQDVNFMYFASAVSAVRQIASCLDEIHDISKELCGEVPFEGFSEWRGEYERTIGTGRAGA